ncbi:unnamed protein product [Aphanomyces euteiches]|uniref:VPS9 domain-containing protein n=1 Tax=Aphanomyces euteiches TaxID=100861 RepID=A0A6G0WSF7_9STRA|nr:hypothetical protein Ae201684_012354 [Aphanomyces euteiches]KAH9157099.1 hypothetical protein AeRB84_001023 [Aphanomyces euteiches]
MDVRPGGSTSRKRQDEVRGDETKSESNLLPPWVRDFADTIKTKKKELLEHASALYASSSTVTYKREEDTRRLDVLTSIFPSWEESTLQLILEAHQYSLDNAITSILHMEAETEYENMVRMSSSQARLQPARQAKNPLPDDFLRVPGYREASDSVYIVEGDEADIDDVDGTAPMDVLKRSDSSMIAHDDGTLYGRELEETSRAVEVPLAVPVNTQPTISIEERRRRMSRPNSRTDSIFAKLTVIKRSKLDIVSAEDRIRTREPHRLLDCLNKASLLYRDGIIASDELENLRSMIITRMQPTKHDGLVANVQTITDHQWNCLVLKCKGLRQALSIRIIKATTSSQHTEYDIRTSDLETGVVVFTRRRFKEFHKFHRKLSALATRVNAFPFPSRQTGLPKKEDLRIASQRQPALEAYLRLVASLVTPSPLTVSRASALVLLQNFLALPDSATLFHNTTLPAIRALRVYAFHVLQDTTTPEGKVIRKFLLKPTVAPATLLEELGDFLDNVQAYMMEHRFDDMKLHVTQYIQDDDSAIEWISDSIRHEVEECLCVPLLPKLWAAFAQNMQVKENAMKARMAKLFGRPQADFAISQETFSLSSWRDAVRTMKEVEAMYLPMDKLRKLLDAANTIHAVYQTEHGGDKVLSGDDFLPIFIYVIVHSQLQNPLVLLRVLHALSDPEKRLGESGYYLASYEAALEHLDSENQ